MSLSTQVAGACRDGDELSAALSGYERLASLALSRRMADDSPIGQHERLAMLRAARLPGALYANPATEAILAADAESLGKGGGIGGFIKNVGKGVQRLAAPITNSVNAFTGMVAGINEAAGRGIAGVAGGLANVATKDANNTGLVNSIAGAALGGMSGMGAIGEQFSGSGSSGPIDQATGLPVATAGGTLDVNTLALIVGAVVVAIFVLKGNRR